MEVIDKKLFYAGIGSRECPPGIIDEMNEFALFANGYDFILRSGGALGADKAFEEFAAYKQIFRPEHATERDIIFTAQFHDAWHRCNEYVQRLHARNALIVMGHNLDTPVKLMVCWQDPEKARGGTRQGMKIAKYFKIPIFNLHTSGNLEKAMKFVQGFKQ